MVNRGGRATFDPGGFSAVELLRIQAGGVVWN